MTLLPRPTIAKILFMLMLYMSLLACASTQHESIPRPNVVLDNATILDVEHKQLLKNRQIWIRDGVIEKITNAGTEVASSYQLIDLQGQYVTPGLIDAHVHLMDKSQLKLSLAMGVTSVRILRGYDMHLAWRDQIKQRDWLGALPFVSSPVLDGANTHALNQAVATPEEGREAVRDFQERGFDLIKAYGYLAPEVYDAIIDEAAKLGMPVAKHAPHPIPGSSWEKLHNLQSLEHVEDIFQGPLNYQFDLSPMPAYLENLKASNTPVVPTLATFAHLTGLSSKKQEFIQQMPMQHMNPLKESIEAKYTVSRWLADTPEQSAYHQKKLAFLLAVTKQLHDYGIPLVTGSDAGTMYLQHGYGMHQEMALLAEAGIPAWDILAMSSLNPAKMLNQEGHLGTISAGKQADLVITRGNPVDSLGHLKTPMAVMAQGKYLDREALAQLKQEATDHSSKLATAARLLKDYWKRN